MTLTLSFKDVLDKPEWRPLAPCTVTHAAAMNLACDMRNDGSRRNPYIYKLSSTTVVEKYLKEADDWIPKTYATLTGGAISAGAFSLFVPSHGPAGTVAGSPTTTSFTLAALPFSATVLPNQLANCGDGDGFMIRVIGKTAGKIEVRRIVGNTSGATPIVYLESALTFTPALTDTYEILSGRLYVLGAGTTAAGYFRCIDIATDAVSGNLSVTNLAATIGTDTFALSLDEQYVPYNRDPGEGFVDNGSTYDSAAYACIVAKAGGSATTIVADLSTGGNATSLIADEYKNFQVRIVEDTVAPTAVGQRRRITSHTAGSSATFTVATWTVTPSSSAKFVIENNNDSLWWTNAATVTYSYAAGGFAADASWSTAAAAGGAMQVANPGTAAGAATMAVSCFSIEPDSNHNVRQGHIIRFRGAASVTVEQLDLTSGSNGVWSTIVPGNMPNATIGAGASGVHSPSVQQGRYFYFVPAVAAPSRCWRLDLLCRVVEPFAYFRYGQTGTAAVGQRMAVGIHQDGTSKLGFVYLLRHLATELFDVVISR